MSAGVKVFAPASVANLGVGYDILGLALEEPGDEVIAHLVDKPGVHIKAIHGDQKKLPLDPHKNTATFPIFQMIEDKDLSGVGVELEIFKKMPFGSGLGSSAASAVAGVVAASAVLPAPFTEKELLHYTMMGEQRADGAWHGDNVAPSLMGGIVLIRDNDSLDYIKLPVPEGLYVTVVYPHVQILTADARAVLGQTVQLSKHIKQSANLASFISALYTSDLELLGRSLDDVLIEPQRAKLIPHFYEAKEKALESGALGCSISGAGPSIFALSHNSIHAENVGAAFEKVFADNGIQTNIYSSLINRNGAIIF